MKKLLNFLLILSSCVGYLEWGIDQHGFLFQFQYDLIFGASRDIKNFAHPMILLPVGGQLILLFTLFQKSPSRIWSLIGLGCLSVLMLMLLLVGIVSLSWKIALSTIPFVVIGILVLKQNWKKEGKLSKQDPAISD